MLLLSLWTFVACSRVNFTFTFTSNGLFYDRVKPEFLHPAINRLDYWRSSVRISNIEMILWSNILTSELLTWFDQSSLLGTDVDKVSLGQMYPRGVRCSSVTDTPPLFRNKISFTYNNTTQL
jgi:hypothetical protein